MKTVAYFLQQGADVDISGKEGNAMQIAIRENQHHILDLLNSCMRCPTQPSDPCAHAFL